jgi:hypothetical protein
LLTLLRLLTLAAAIVIVPYDQQVAAASKDPHGTQAQGLKAPSLGGAGLGSGLEERNGRIAGGAAAAMHGEGKSAQIHLL